MAKSFLRTGVAWDTTHLRRKGDGLLMAGLRAARLAVMRLAADQHGVFHLEQAVTAGLPAAAVYRFVRVGEWARVFERVFATDTRGGGWRRLLAALCLWAGPAAAASHRSAGALWELDGIEPGVVEIVCPGPKRAPSTAVRVHETNRPFTIHRRLGIPVTAITRTLIDLGCIVSDHRLEFALEDALRRGLTTMPRLKTTLEEEGGKGRPGARALRRVVQGRGDATPPTASWLETRLSIVARRAGIPQPERQHRVRRPDGREAYHRDRVRGNDLVTLGWRVLHVTEEDLAGDARELVAVLKRLVGTE
jgi:putative AbiEi antitoxin of type IV toxin-antitoxin system